MSIFSAEVVLTFFLPVKTVSETNMWEHWGARYRRAKSQRTLARAATRDALETAGKMAPPYVVHMTRVASRKLDSDNLQASAKHIRDGIAEAIGVDDGRDDLVRWEYAQETGKEVGVRVVVRGQEAE